MSAYAAFADELRATGLVVDPWLRGEPRFSAAPIVLSQDEWARAARCAEDVAAVHDEVVRACAQAPELLGSFFGLTPIQQAMFHAQAPAWHGIARADVFFTDRGPVCCELNSDTPSGEPEAVVLGAHAARSQAGLVDPSAQLEARFGELVLGLAPRPRPVIGIVYPTEMTEDLALVTLYRRWLEARGLRVVLGSPFNLTPGPGRAVHLLGERCDVIVRHYKTDWWGEREPVWDDVEPFADAAPLEGPLSTLALGALAGTCAIVNPLGAVLAQNKRAMAFMWERMDVFSEPARRAIRALVPRTVRLEAAGDDARDRARWVLKSDYGCEGGEVIVGARVSDEEWRACLAHAIRRRWVLQERFDAPGVNVGVYVVAGRAAGAYGRVQEGPTDERARSAAVVVRAT